jgi:hypothetical protein
MDVSSSSLRSVRCGSRPISRLVTSDGLKVRDDCFPLDALVVGDGAKYPTEGSESERMVVWNRDPVKSRLGGLGLMWLPTWCTLA